MVLINLRFKPTPKGTDAVYVYIPGKLDMYYIRPDWLNANYIIAAAVTYLGRKGQERKRETGGKEEIWLGCTLFDFIFEPFPTFNLVDIDELEPGGREKIIPFEVARRRSFR